MIHNTGRESQNQFINTSAFLYCSDITADYCIVLYCIVLYCIEGVVIAVQCTATFTRSIVLPRIQVLLGREYAD